MYLSHQSREIRRACSRLANLVQTASHNVSWSTSVIALNGQPNKTMHCVINFLVIVITSWTTTIGRFQGDRITSVTTQIWLLTNARERRCPDAKAGTKFRWPKIDSDTPFMVVFSTLIIMRTTRNGDPQLPPRFPARCES